MPTPPSVRLAATDREAARDLLGHPEVAEVAAGLGITPTQLLLAWAIRPLDGNRDVIVIPKATRLAHVEQNAAALSVELDAESLARLDAAFPAPHRKTPLDIV
ncbi:aldo/keto reductase [Halomonas sp. ATCH28]|uniref:Aldo/keto reductase n=1 Tax=Halomonas gemina TaxID=2945105 RepID=A0ABT0SZC9_9GAMM|nr:aldo/keto reductase [Halomonas gemina]MCL7939972.1 aldo/keto reductase [Halomonas gemina]